jgi:hypothetical protein
LIITALTECAVYVKVGDFSSTDPYKTGKGNTRGENVSEYVVLPSALW